MGNLSSIKKTGDLWRDVVAFVDLLGLRYSLLNHIEMQVNSGNSVLGISSVYRGRQGGS